MKYSIVFRLLIHHTYFYTLWVVYILHFNNIQFIRLHVLITDSSRFCPRRASKNFLSTGPQLSHFFSFSLLLSLFAVSDFQWLSFTCHIPLVSFRGTDAHKADRKEWYLLQKGMISLRWSESEDFIVSSMWCEGKLM